MVYKNFRAESRKIYGHEKSEDVGLTLEQLNAGSLQRIADSLESMARGYTDLERNARAWKERAESLERSLAVERRRSSALRGHLTRLRARQ